MARFEEATFPVAASARTTSGVSSASLTPASCTVVNLSINCTAASGTTPTLDVSVEWSVDGGFSWNVADTADAFTQITAAKVVTKQFAVRGPLYRVRWAITGTTPSFTFGVETYGY